MTKPRINALCNDCGFRTQHPTRSKAFASMQAHEDETGHMDQVWQSDVGWTRYKPLTWANCTVN